MKAILFDTIEEADELNKKLAEHIMKDTKGRANLFVWCDIQTINSKYAISYVDDARLTSFDFSSYVIQEV